MEKSRKIRTCQHLLNGEYSVSIFDNGDIMCKACALQTIQEPNYVLGSGSGKHIVEKDAIEMYQHLKKIFSEKAGPYDPIYPNNYLIVLNGLNLLPKDLMKVAVKLQKD